MELFIALIITFLSDGVCVLLTNRITFDSPISYVNVGFHEITVFLKNDMNSNQNKVVLFDIYNNKTTVLNENVNLQSNIIKSIYDINYRNDISNNIYADVWKDLKFFTENLTNSVDLYTADLDT